MALTSFAQRCLLAGLCRRRTTARESNRARAERASLDADYLLRCRVRAHRLRGAAQQASDASDDLTTAEIAAATASAAAAALLIETLRKQLQSASSEPKKKMFIMTAYRSDEGNLLAKRIHDLSLAISILR